MERKEKPASFWEIREERRERVRSRSREKATFENSEKENAFEGP